MVMHARKYPRHNDGYYDRTQAHPFEDKYPSKSQSSGGGASGSYNDRYGDKSSSKESPSGYRVREDSPGRPSPRYQNKSSYKDRVKDRASKGSNNSPGDSRANHHYNPNSRSEPDRHTPSSTSSKSYKSLESLKSEPKDPKTEQIQKNALRVSGDWSEHRSSSGKKYYYNCKSEISQWEKPKNWIELSANLGRPTDNSRAKDRNGREARTAFPTATSTKSSESERYRHSSGGSGVPPSSSATCSTRSSYPSSSSACHSAAHSRSSVSMHTSTASSTTAGFGSSPASATYDHRLSHGSHKDGGSGESHRDRADIRKHWTIPNTDQRYGDHSHGNSSGRDSGLQRIPVVCRSHSDAGNYSGSGGGGVGGHHRHGSSSRSRDDRQHGDEYHHHHSHKGSNAFNGARNSGDLSRNDNEDSRQTEDMDISPGSTPTSSRPNSHIGTPSSSLNNAHMTAPGHHPSSNVNMGNNLTQAIQTLQKLQQALMQQHQLHQQQQTNTSVSQSPRHPPDATPPHGQAHASPHFNNSRAMLSHQLSTLDDDSREGRESPKSDRSIRNSRRGSPTCSMASSPSVTLSGSSLGAANKKQDSVQLTPSLSNYYKDSLVEHCSNIQADQAERQANRYGEEAHSVGTLHCTQVSVDLKRARSLVRIAEIQATLHEQRVLFLRQETRDLENMRSQNSFMPSQQGT